MFTLATYLGYVLTPEMPVVGALIATLAVFLPGFLLLLGVLKNWSALAQRPKVAGAMQGVNACVVGLLLAAEIGLASRSSAKTRFTGQP
ncbi:chromate transporter [Vibrio cholerae]|nr:chromate transporter [Vibrio cholerae]